MKCVMMKCLNLQANLKEELIILEFEFRKSLLASIALLLISCVNEINQPKLGKYRFEMITKDGSILPFNFEFLKKSEQLIMKVENGEETLIYDEIRIESDSIKILMPPFDAVIIVKADGTVFKWKIFESYRNII